ncbi:MAG: glycosyltransferase [Scrofimicrobium sp.]
MIDIFVPFWGKPSQLFEAVESVKAQSSPNWRLTIVDDCYPEDVSAYFVDQSDPRIRYIRNDQNLGIIENFAKCQSLAEGDYTVFMGCDDLLDPEYVEVIEKVASRLPGIEIIQPGVEVIDENGEVTSPLADKVKTLIRPRGSGTIVISGENAAKSLLVGDWLYWPSLAFRTEALKTVEFLPDYEIILDLGLILDLIQGGARIAIVPETVFKYRRHSESLSSQALLDGPRFEDERRFFSDRADQLQQMGWTRAARSARTHITSRAYALTLLPTALKSKNGLRALLQHVVS